MLLTPNRDKKLRDAIAKKQFNLTIILENVHDPHNIGAVLRSCEGVGITEIFVIYSEESYDDPEQRYIGVNASTGTAKWVAINYFDNVDDCIKAVRNKYDKIYATHLTKESKSLYGLDLFESCALMFGNESVGISEEAMQYVDANFLIPMAGMIQSLNISVACAISLFEAQRQRITKGMYDLSFDFDSVDHVSLYRKYINASRPGVEGNPQVVEDYINEMMNSEGA